MGLKVEREVVSEYLDVDGFQDQSSSQSTGACYKSEDIVNAGLLWSRILSSWSPGVVCVWRGSLWGLVGVEDQVWA